MTNSETSTAPAGSPELKTRSDVRPDVVYFADVGGDTDDLWALYILLHPQSGFGEVTVVVGAPRIGDQSNERDVEASNEKLRSDAAIIRSAVDAICEHLGRDPNKVPVYHGLDRGDARTDGLAASKIAPDVVVDIANHHPWQDKTETNRDRLAGGYDELVAHLAERQKSHFIIGCSATEAAALLEEQILKDKIGQVVMQASLEPGQKNFSAHSYNGDMHVKAFYRILARGGTSIISSDITRATPLSYADGSKLREGLADAADFLLNLTEKVYTEKRRRNLNREPLPGQIASDRITPISLTDARMALLARGLLVPGENNPFSLASHDTATALRNLERDFPEHITPDFVRGLGQMAAPIPPTYHVASIEHVDAPAVHELTERLTSRPDS